MLKKTLVTIAIAGLLAAPVRTQSQPTPKPGRQTAKPEQQTPRPEPAETLRPVQGASVQEAMPFPAPGGVGGGQAVNVRLELTITDQTGPGEPTKKVITMIVADRQNGFIRSKAAVRVPVGPSAWQYQDLPINVDARPVILGPRNENIRVDLGLEYQPSARMGGNAVPEPGMSNLNERISVILEPGKPLTISQAADPASDRRISVELKATILK